MGVLPNGNTDKIAFFENHLTTWGANFAAIGLTTDQVTQIAALTNDARSKYNAAQVARNDARSATGEQNDAIDAMASYGADLVKTIRAFAQTENDPSIFNTANIPAPKPREPLGPAPTPENVLLSTTNNGGISIGWDAETRGRMAFVIERQTMPAGGNFGPWSIIGTTTTKNFIDETVPAGLERAVYRVTAERPGGRSQPSVSATAYFGVTGLTGGQPGSQPGSGDIRIAA